MKAQILVLAVVIALSGTHCIAAYATNVSTGGTSEITEGQVTNLLRLYADISGLELVIASNVKQVRSRVVALPERHGERWDFAKLCSVIQKALLDQRGVVIMRLDDKRASVTYNDALKAAPIKDTLTLPMVRVPIQKQ